MYSSDSAEDSEKERTSKGRIGRIARKRFESMLRAMSGKRVEIARAMEFALKHAEAADEVRLFLATCIFLDECADRVIGGRTCLPKFTKRRDSSPAKDRTITPGL